MYIHAEQEHAKVPAERALDNEIVSIYAELDQVNRARFLDLALSLMREEGASV